MEAMEQVEPQTFDFLCWCNIMDNPIVLKNQKGMITAYPT